MKVKAFTRKQKLFIAAYCQDPNGTKAAIASGSPPGSAGQVASNMLKDVRIKGEIDRRLALTFDRYAVTSDRVIRELSKIAFGNLADFVTLNDDTGEFNVDFTGATADQMAALNAVESHEYMDGRGDDARPVKRMKISMSDKKGALVELARLMRLYAPDRIEHSGPDGGPIQHLSGNVNINVTPLDIRGMTPEERDVLRTVMERTLAKPKDSE